MTRIPVFLLVAGCLATPCAAQCDPTELAKLVATDGLGDAFGSAIAFDGVSVVVGAPNDTNFAGSNAGSAYIYIQKDGKWKQTAHLFANSGSHGYLGSSVSVNGQFAVAGAPGNDTALGTDAGAAYVFKRNANGNWVPAATLTDPDGAVDDWFGGASAVVGDTILVGSFGDDTPSGKDAGSVSVFHLNGQTWEFETKLVLTAGAPKDYFGSPIAFDGETAVIGSSKAVYVFARSNGKWTQEAKLTGGAGNGFGGSIALDGNTIVVGAPNENTAKGMSAGAAYIFAYTDGAWKFQGKVLASDGAEYNYFGRAVAASGHTALVGASDWQLRVLPQVGSAYVFTSDNGQWTQQARFTGSDSDQNDQFGWAVALRNGRAVVGADMVGAAYVFDLHCSGPCPADCDGSGELDIDDFICFQTLFAQGSFKADCNGDQFIDIDDFICFQTAFGAGCG